MGNACLAATYNMWVLILLCDGQNASKLPWKVSSIATRELPDHTCTRKMWKHPVWGARDSGPRIPIEAELDHVYRTIRKCTPTANQWNVARVAPTRIRQEKQRRGSPFALTRRETLTDPTVEPDGTATSWARNRVTCPGHSIENVQPNTKHNPHRILRRRFERTRLLRLHTQGSLHSPPKKRRMGAPNASKVMDAHPNHRRGGILISPSHPSSDHKRHLHPRRCHGRGKKDKGKHSPSEPTRDTEASMRMER